MEKENQSRKRRRERVFRMKQFAVRHERSANKVGVDGVLVGAMAGIPADCRRVLDAGCGCGLIALMLAQRCSEISPDAQIIGIDVESEAVEEARENVALSPWPEKIDILKEGIDDIARRIAAGEAEAFQLIVSNPPFFHAGVEDVASSSRTLARHCGSLSPSRLIQLSPLLLTNGGELALIAPAEDLPQLGVMARQEGLQIVKTTLIKGNPNVAPKRVVMQLRKPRTVEECAVDTLSGDACTDDTFSGDASAVDALSVDIGNKGEIAEVKDAEILTIEVAPGEYTEEYIDLCRAFYIKF